MNGAFQDCVYDEVDEEEGDVWDCGDEVVEEENDVLDCGVEAHDVVVEVEDYVS